MRPAGRGTPQGARIVLSHPEGVNQAAGRPYQSSARAPALGPPRPPGCGCTRPYACRASLPSAPRVSLPALQTPALPPGCRTSRPPPCGAQRSSLARRPASQADLGPPPAANPPPSPTRCPLSTALQHSTCNPTSLQFAQSATPFHPKPPPTSDSLSLHREQHSPSTPTPQVVPPLDKIMFTPTPRSLTPGCKITPERGRQPL